jgi:hypothetical protein
MTLTHSLVEVTDYVVAKLEANRDALGLYAVYFGDQRQIPGTPVVCVEPDHKRNELISAFRKIEVVCVLQIIIYHSKVTDTQTNRRGADILAEDIEDLLHADPQLGGLAIHCYVTSVNSGYSTKADALMRSCRIQFEVESQNQLPGS